jgi:hypothetical protein
MKKAIGYSLFVLSCITWGGVATIPYWDVSMGVAAAYTTGLLIIGEIAFFLSVILLGKEFLMKIKNFWVKLKFFFRSKGIDIISHAQPQKQATPHGDKRNHVDL